MLSKTEGVSVQVSVIKNFKYQNTNTKWFDKLTTTLSQVEGQITMTKFKIPNNRLLVLFEIWIL